MNDNLRQDAPAEGAEMAAALAPEMDRVAALEAEVADLKDRLLRALAETENVRRRAEREAREARDYAVTSFAREILSVSDNLQRALDAATPDVRAVAENFVAGVEVTQRELLSILEKHGIKRLDPAGQRFDPHLHQAMYEVPNPDIPAGTVVQVLQPGYTIGERCLRPALVAVAKGGPKAEA